MVAGVRPWDCYQFAGCKDRSGIRQNALAALVHERGILRFRLFFVHRWRVGVDECNRGVSTSLCRLFAQNQSQRALSIYRQLTLGLEDIRRQTSLRPQLQDCKDHSCLIGEDFSE